MTTPQPSEKKAFLVLMVILGAAFFTLLQPVLIALSLAAIIAVLVYPLYAFFLRRCRRKKYVASFITTLLIFLVLILPFTVVTALLVKQSMSVLGNLQFDGVISVFKSNDFYQSYMLPLVAKVEHTFGIHLDLARILSEFGKSFVLYIYSYSPQVLGLTATVVFGFFVMHFSLFFLFIEGPQVMRVILDLSPLKKTHEMRLTGEIKKMINATVYGYLLTALVQSILAGVGFWIAGVPVPLVFATLTYFMSLVPIVGATSVWLPISLWLFVKGEVGWAIFLSIYGALVISGIDNIIKPWIMQGKARVHILLIFFSLLGGLTLFGPIGILFGPVITAMFLACVRIYREDFLNKNGEFSG